MEKTTNELGFVESLMETFEDHHIVQGCAKHGLKTSELLALMEKYPQLDKFMKQRFPEFNWKSLKKTEKQQATGKASGAKQSEKKEVENGKVPEGTVGKPEGETSGDAEHNDDPAEGDDPSGAKQ